MKKSTLITTIAMIVVVVVALSTATYAWFTSSSATSIDANITTEAGSGWLLMGGAYTADGNVVKYDSKNALNMQFMDGLHSPDAVIDMALTSKQANTAINGRDYFYEAEYESQEARSTSGRELQIPTLLRVINADTSARQLDLRITVYLEGDDDASFKAGNAFRTYIAAYGTTAYTANTSYRWGAIATTTTGEDAGYYLAEEDQNSPAAASTSTLAPTYTPGYSPTEAVPYNGWQKLTVAARVGSTDLAANTCFYTITFSFENVQSNNAVNFAFYTWLDGWELDDTARGASVKLIYEFGRPGDFVSYTSTAYTRA